MTRPLGILSARYRGFRIVDLTAVGLLTVLVLAVYFFKANAGSESAKIADVDRQIAAEQRHVRLLSAELSYLERPDRLESLSAQYLNLGPLSGKREISAESLAEVARQAPETKK